MKFKIRLRWNLMLFLILQINGLLSIQSNNTCAPIPRDRRQLICTCAKQLQLRCIFNIDIKEIDAKDLDKTLNPIYYSDISIDRQVNPDDLYDININFKQIKKSNPNKVYLYFPNFNTLNSPYIRITFIRFQFIPSFSFYMDRSLDLNSLGMTTRPQKHFESVVFEIQDVFDFGIDRYAFYNTQIDSLLIEGPFNQMAVHRDAFASSSITELNIGCYCVECESFVGDCRILFSRPSLSAAEFPSPLDSKINSTFTLKSLKLYGIQLGEQYQSQTQITVNRIWLDELPNMINLEQFELNNFKIQPSQLSSNNNPYDYEFKSTMFNSYPNLIEFTFKNNNLKYLRKKLISMFTGLKYLSLAQNQIEYVDADTFTSNPNLIEINLERNKIKRINKNIFSFGSNRETNLKILNLKENLIEQLDDNQFDSLKKLEILDLTRNKISILTENTFNGLSNLKQLFLSYNPLKKIDINAFKYLSIESKLNRLDMISNAEADWFIFDNNDICLLAHFKCNTQIHIDVDQRCNCFVKYLNHIGSQVDSGSDLIIRDESDDILWRKPCFQAVAPKPVEDFASNADETLYLEEIYRHNRDPFLYLQSSQTVGGDNSVKELDTDIPVISCSKNLIKKCYSVEEQLSSGNGSCLYKTVLEQNLPKEQSTTASEQSEKIENESDLTTKISSETINLIHLHNHKHNKQVDVSLNNEEKYHKSSKLTNSDQDQKAEVAVSNSPSSYSSSTFKVASLGMFEKYSLESSLLFILCFIGVVFFISTISLFMSIYLFLKRNRFVYHTTDSSYPQDER